MKKFENLKLNPILIAFLVLITSFLLYQMVGGVLTFALAGLKITPANAGIIRIISSINQIIFLLILPIFASKFFYNNFNDVFKIKKPQPIEIFLAIFGLIFLIISTQVYSYLQSNFLDFISAKNSSIAYWFEAIKKADKLLQEAYSNLIKINNLSDYMSIVISIAIVPAFCEEFLFRGFVLSSFQQKFSPFFAVLITGLIFGLIHFNLLAILPLIALGVYFSYLAYKTGSIFIPIILHFLNNFITVTLNFYIGGDWVLDSAPKVPVPNSTLIFLFLSNIFLFILTMFILHKVIKIKNSKTVEN